MPNNNQLVNRDMLKFKCLYRMDSCMGHRKGSEETLDSDTSSISIMLEDMDKWIEAVRDANS